MVGLEQCLEYISVNCNIFKIGLLTITLGGTIIVVISAIYGDYCARIN